VSADRIGPTARRGAGVILLEVLISLTLFVIAAAVVGSAMWSALHATTEMRTESRAVNLAQWILAELEMGTLPMADTPPTEFTPGDEDEPAEPAEGADAWTYEIVTADLTDTPALKQVTVIVRNADPFAPYEFRLTQWMMDTATEEMPEGADAEGAL